MPIKLIRNEDAPMVMSEIVSSFKPDDTIIKIHKNGDITVTSLTNPVFLGRQHDKNILKLYVNVNELITETFTIDDLKNNYNSYLIFKLAETKINLLATEIRLIDNEVYAIFTITEEVTSVTNLNTYNIVFAIKEKVVNGNITDEVEAFTSALFQGTVESSMYDLLASARDGGKQGITTELKKPTINFGWQGQNFILTDTAAILGYNQDRYITDVKVVIPDYIIPTRTYLVCHNKVLNVTVKHLLENNTVFLDPTITNQAGQWDISLILENDTQRVCSNNVQLSVLDNKLNNTDLEEINKQLLAASDYASLVTTNDPLAPNVYVLKYDGPTIDRLLTKIDQGGIDLEPATSNRLGGIKADAKVSENIPVVIDENAKLFVRKATKQDVNLENVNNTSDINKPISTATQTALDNKANTKGTYVDLNVGHADTALVAKKLDTEDGVHYGGTFISRITADGNPIKDDSGILTELKGNTIVANQLIKVNDGEKVYQQDGLTFSKKDNYFIINGTATAKGSFTCNDNYPKAIQNHIYYVGGFNTLPNASTIQAYLISGENNTPKVFKANGSGSTNFQLFYRIGDTFTNFVLKPTISDLTKAIGITEIIDKTDIRVQAIVNYLNKNYKLNTGTLVSATPTKLVSYGRNLCDQEFDYGIITTGGEIGLGNKQGIINKNYIKIVPNKEYSIKSFTLNQGTDYNAIYGCFYDKDKKNIGGRISFNNSRLNLAPTNARYLRFFILKDGLTDWGNIPSDIKAFVSIETQPTTYIPYIAPNEITIKYPSGVSELRSAGLVYDSLTNKLYTKRVESIELGKLEENWSIFANNESLRQNPSLRSLAKKPESTTQKANISCNKYVNLPLHLGEIGADKINLSIALSPNGYLLTHDSKFETMTNDQVKQYLLDNNIVLQYELLTPITTPIEPEADYSYDAHINGIEEFQGTEIPVVADIEYTDNFEAKVKGLPTGKELAAEFDRKQDVLALTPLTETYDQAGIVIREAKDHTLINIIAAPNTIYEGASLNNSTAAAKITYNNIKTARLIAFDGYKHGGDGLDLHLVFDPIALKMYKKITVPTITHNPGGWVTDVNIYYSEDTNAITWEPVLDYAGDKIFGVTKIVCLY